MRDDSDNGGVDHGTTLRGVLHRFPAPQPAEDLPAVHPCRPLRPQTADGQRPDDQNGGIEVSEMQFNEMLLNDL
jgi:hypothetical protein